MDSFSIFILCLFGIWTLNAMHLRRTRAKLIRYLVEVEGKSADEVTKIMKVYKED